jgi:hypothetical protein
MPLVDALRTRRRRPTRAVAGGLAVVAHAQLMSPLAPRNINGVSHMMMVPLLITLPPSSLIWTRLSLRATFFVVGSRVTTFPGLLQQEYLAGHQIAVHTWSHPSLTTQSTEQIIAEFGWTRKIIHDVLGVQPSYMRPPYGDIECVFPVLVWYGVDELSYYLVTVCVLFHGDEHVPRHVDPHQCHCDF